MPVQDTLSLKEKILDILKRKGPNIPIYIAREIGQSGLFISAFLSELLSEKRLKTSYMRIGSSPVYFLTGQEKELEKFSDNLKSKEKEAYLLLKEKKFLIDSEQEPAIRVALRSIKDFALPFRIEEKIVWRYFTIPETEFELIKQKQEEDNTQKIKEQTIQEEVKITQEKEEKTEEKQEIKAKATKKKAQKKKPMSNKKNDKFFDKIKESLSEKSIEIISIEGFNKEDLTLKILQNKKEKLLVAYNKKRVTEEDILKANKKAEGLNLPYIILSKGEPAKKLNNLIDAIKNLSSIDKID